MKPSIDTQLIHTGEPKPRIGGAVSMPIFQSAFSRAASFSLSAVSMPIFQSAMFEDGDGELRYIRYNNTPNQKALNEKLAALENAEAALVTGSGMAAISTALLTVLKSGDHLLAQNGLYGGTHSFVTHLLPDLDIAVDFIDADAPETWEALLRPTTRAIYVESITNPLMQVCDLDAITAFAKASARPCE